MSLQAKFSTDGYTWTKPGGLKGGVHSYGVVDPPRQINPQQENQIWECIVVGAGYCGLIAARDLVKAGKKTLLLEARDRVGGRSWSAEINGTTFEMGGTWVSHVHGRLFAEMERYGLKDDVSLTRTEGGGCGYFTLDTGSGSRKLPLEAAGEMTHKAWKIFVDFDGKGGRTAIPLPHSSVTNPRIDPVYLKKIDQISCRDRIEQIRHQLTADELALMESVIPHITGGTVENCGFLEMLRANALQGFTPETFEEVWTLYKIRQGQSALGRKIFNDAARLGLQYSFKTPIKSFKDRPAYVEIRTTNGQVFKARRVINTIPLAVLPTIEFDPPLSALRREAIEVGHTNYLTKVHAEVEGDMRGFRGCTWPGDLLYAYGDGFCAGNKTTRVTSFAGDNRGKLDPIKEPERLCTALQRFHPMEIKKLVFHDWISDPYAMAGPAWYSAGYLTKYLSELQKRHGNILMANSDWAYGWRAFIEGAMEQGALAADTVMNEVGIEGVQALYKVRDAHL